MNHFVTSNPSFTFKACIFLNLPMMAVEYLGLAVCGLAKTVTDDTCKYYWSTRLSSHAIKMRTLDIHNLDERVIQFTVFE